MAALDLLPAVIKLRSAEPNRALSPTLEAELQAWFDGDGTAPVPESAFFGSSIERTMLLAASHPRRETLRALLAPTLAGLPLPNRGAYGLLLGDLDTIHAVAREVMALPNPNRLPWIYHLYAHVRDGATLLELVKTHPQQLQIYTFHARHLLDGPPENAAELFALALTNAKRWKYRPGEIKSLALYAACLVDDDVAKALAALAAVKNITPIATEYFSRHPSLVHHLEAAVAAMKPRDADVGRAILGSLARRESGATQPSKKAKTPKGAEPSKKAKTPKGAEPKPRAAKKASPSRDDAAPSHTHALLVPPPWERARPPRPRASLDLEDDVAALVAPLDVHYRVADVDALIAKLDSHLQMTPRDLRGYASGDPRVVPAALTHAMAKPTDHVDLFLATRGRAAVRGLVAALARSNFERARIEDYMVRELEHAAPTLLQLALGDDDAQAFAASSLLQMLARRGFGAALGAHAGQHGVADALAAILDMDPMVRFPPKVPSLPKSFDLGRLPLPRTRDGQTISRASAEAIVRAVLAAPNDGRHAALTLVREACEPDSLDAFAWAVYEDWIAGGARAAGAFAIEMIGHLGSAAQVARLEASSRAWPGTRSVELMQRALDVLGLVGSDEALALLSLRASTATFEDTRQRAQALLSRAADLRGVSVDTLESGLVPALDLSPLDFGARRFAIVIDELLRPSLRDDDGKILEAPPKPRKADDASLAKAATARWRTLRDTLGAIVRSHASRLERAMRDERDYARETFDALRSSLVGTSLVTRLAWADAGGRLLRVDETGDFVDAADRPFAPRFPLRVAHPLRLDDAERRAMTERFADYGITQPFPQLGREVASFTEAELASRELTCTEGVTMSFAAVLELIATAGWRRTPVADTMARIEHPLPGGGHASVALAPGLTFGEVKARPDQKLGRLTLHGPRGEAPPTFGELPELLRSELLRDLACA
ncbi:MAG: DUF4132 domain-containing protein [Myxococcales bacterium]|nr:DUF4132 domain-containing protein [Myxococcales bacterium]